jgi:hypothetical protein
MLVEPDIAPLAKRLAEENNVNWRGLLGSGAGGKIVERDVLEYLAKVMAGEEDVNPTAEPLPEGMDAWPEDDVRSFYGGAVPIEATPEETLDIDAPDLDIPNLGAFEAPAAVSTQSASVEQNSSDLGEDIFLIDEVEESEGISVTQSAVEPTFELESDEGVSDVATFDDISDFETAETEVMSAISTDPSEDLFSSDDDVEDLAALFVDDAHDNPVVETDSFEEPFTDDVAAFEAPAEPTFDIPAYSELASDDSVQTFEVETPAVFEADVMAEGIFQDTFAMPEEVVSEPEFVENTFVENTIAETLPEVERSFEPSFTPDVAAPAIAAGVVGAGVVGASVLGMTAMQAESSQVQTPANLPLVSYGILLRRHVDLTTLVQAQHAVAEEIGQDEPVAITSFLLRAAAKAQHKVALVSGQSIGLAVIRNQGISVVAMSEASSASFRHVVSHTQQAASSQAMDKVDLVVADMSGFNIDEAVLNVGAPVLTLGRTLYDSSKGTHHSTLSLSGNVSVESGTKFLSAVAELLNSPVRLVV